MDLQKSMLISAAGLKAQSVRMRVISENIANSDSVANTPGGDPYRRKIITFVSEFDRAMGLEHVKPGKVIFDQKEFGSKFDPGAPGADGKGYVKTTNVNGLIEAMDMRQAQRTYQANLNAIESARRMAQQTVQLLQAR